MPTEHSSSLLTNNTGSNANRVQTICTEFTGRGRKAAGDICSISQLNHDCSCPSLLSLGTINHSLSLAGPAVADSNRRHCDPHSFDGEYVNHCITKPTPYSTIR
ncbi:hypothetical protein PoB_002406500 [Plakobranchus ocellatus]|uniref:Uncharacterized protein n=1 Tax=Plakobranchus ocellatus TaxID=259542 RepID=A0AAV3ZQZ2_9GAST|nr:hypothetical protein PoB_002406500 [Plakobranchus ocellatus]